MIPGRSGDVTLGLGQPLDSPVYWELPRLFLGDKVSTAHPPPAASRNTIPQAQLPSDASPALQLYRLNTFVWMRRAPAFIFLDYPVFEVAVGQISTFNYNIEQLCELDYDSLHWSSPVQ